MDTDKIKYFFPKLKNRLQEERVRFWKWCNVERLAARGYKPFDNTAIFKTNLQSMLGAFDSTLLSDINEEERVEILSSANQAMRHEFNLLGSGPIILDPIDWQLDFKSGKKWPKKYYRELVSIKGSDIKVPWELSRCQHLLWLGEAYLLTEEEKYAKEVIEEINWWIDDNPLMYTVNWKCAMDVAFRAVNWLFSLNMIASYKDFNDTFVSKVSYSLWQHGFFIYSNLEKNIPYSRNHYTSDLAGLLYIGMLFDYTRKGNKWKRRALREYYSEIRTQILSSGAHYERSISYHRLMTEMLSYPVYMLERMGEKIPKDVKARISKMYKYIAAYTKPNGMAPLIADNDDGRFLPFLRRDFRNHSYLNDCRSIENSFVSVGGRPQFCIPLKDSGIYEDAGVAIVNKNDDYLFINNGGYSGITKNSQSRLQSHTHNDLLSFELVLGGRDVLVDSGAFLYTSSEEDRNAFRSSYKHNTVVVDNEEQNGFISPFTLHRNIHNIQLRKINDCVYEGEYTTIKGNFHHLRRFELKHHGLIINDVLTKEGNNHKAEILFHFAEGVIPVLHDECISLNNGISLSYNLKPSEVFVLDDTLSPSYGVLVPNKTVKMVFYFNEKIEIATKIEYSYGIK